jgi:hypothetical protein
MGGYDYDGLRKLKELGISHVSFHTDGTLASVAFVETKQEVVAQPFPLKDLMPPDDQMLFMSSEGLPEDEPKPE